MNFIYQNRYGAEGNCFQACLASLFDCQSLDEMPDPCFLMHRKECNWMLQVQKMLIKRFCATLRVADEYFPQQNPEALYIQTVLNEPSGLFHVVICQAGRIIHDPNPEKTSRLPNGNYNTINERLAVQYGKKVQHLDSMYSATVEAGIISDALFDAFFSGPSTIENPFIFPPYVDWNKPVIKRPALVLADSKIILN